MPQLPGSDPKNVFFKCVEGCNEAIMLTDGDGVVIYVNPAWVRIYGYTQEEAIGKTPRLIHSGHQSTEFYEKMWQAITESSTGSWKGELINRSKSGTLVPVLLTITPYRSETGQIIGYMGIAMDLTYKKELEEKVVHQDRLASIGLLASGLAHEVGTPLGVIRGRAEFLQMKDAADSPNKDLAVIVEQTDRISKLIRSLLRMSRGFGDIRTENVSVHHVASEVMALVGQNLKEYHANIIIDAPEELEALADIGRLEQILLNLVVNSIHAIKHACSSGRTSDHYLTIRATRRNSKVAVEVHDSGCGIPPSDMKKLFKPFFTTKEVGEGTGLGLAIVAQLVREMNGEISVQSRVDSGTQFTILLNAPA